MEIRLILEKQSSYEDNARVEGVAADCSDATDRSSIYCCPSIDVNK